MAKKVYSQYQKPTTEEVADYVKEILESLQHVADPESFPLTHALLKMTAVAIQQDLDAPDLQNKLN